MSGTLHQATERQKKPHPNMNNKHFYITTSIGSERITAGCLKKQCGPLHTHIAQHVSQNFV
jgi:hypothetical protein